MSDRRSVGFWLARAILAPATMIATIAIASCGGSDGGGELAPGDASFGDGGGDGVGDGVIDGGQDAGDASGFDVIGPEADVLGCSADLRAVTDATGAVVKTCGPDQGCSAGVCVEACLAAGASHGNVGCDFRVPTPPVWGVALPPCFAVFLANTWPRPAKIGVTRGTATFDITTFARIAENDKPAAAWKPVPASGIPVDQVAVLFMSGDPASVFTETGVSMSCPVPTAVGASSMLESSGKGEAFHITSDTPLSAYDIIPYGGALSHFPSAELVFPTNAWGKNYMMIATPPGTHDAPGPLWGQIVAAQDDTTVQVLPSVDLPSSGVFAAAPKGKTASYTLAAGQYLQWQLPAGSSDLSGTVILSDKPVAAFAGNRFFRLQPTPKPGGESTHQEIPPISALGSEYVAAPYASRRADLADESIYYRLVGAFDGTKLTFDPPFAAAPPTLSQGQVADFQVPGAFRVTSQDAAHPFAAAQIMPTANVPDPPGPRPGATAPGYGPWLGDEEFVVMLPPQQFLSKYVFFSDPIYPTTNLALTRVKTSKGFRDVTVDCLGVVSGWKDVGTSGSYQVATVDLVRAGIGAGACTNGHHVAESDGPIGVVVWGEDSYSSYAYPAGGNAATLTTAVVSPLPK